MKKLTLFLLIVVITVFSCNRGNGFTNTCSVNNPVEDLTWLKKEIQDLQETDPEFFRFFSVSPAFYEGETVFVFNNCCPNCNTVVLVKNWNGETISYLGYEDEDIDPDALEDKVIIWQPDDFVCTYE